MQQIKEIKLINFRNYINESIVFSKNMNILLGKNAQGKTNILEAIYLTAFGRSYRTSAENDFIRWQSENTGVGVVISRKYNVDEINITFRHNEKKRITYNTNVISNAELFAIFNVVIFSPEDLWLIKGAPAARRKFLDLEISQADKIYYKYLLQYNRALMQRNKLLKRIKERKAAVDLLDVWDAQIIDLACRIIKKRFTAIKRISMLANLVQRKITEGRENFSIGYHMHGFTDEENHEKSIWQSDYLAKRYNELLTENREKDIILGSTSVGPHRDDLIFHINGNNIKKYGSQGQQRTAVLSLKIAELEYIKSEVGYYPIFLLDDVFSELDADRREQLLAFLKDRVQTFITTTDNIIFDRYGYDVFKVEEGKVMLLNEDAGLNL